MHVALLAADGWIVRVNKAWRRFRTPYLRERVGVRKIKQRTTERCWRALVLVRIAWPVRLFPHPGPFLEEKGE